MEPKARLSETAVTLFCERGYDAVGTQEIVESAGVTKPTLYHHYGSKRGLLEAVQRSIWTELMRRLEQPLRYEHDLSGTLEAIAATFLRYASECPRETRLVVSTRSGPVESEARQVMRPYIDALDRAMTVLFIRAARDHGNMRGRHVAYARSFLGTLFTYATLILDHQVDLTDDLPRLVVHQFSHGIYS